jgi:hypothetical protein
VRFFKRSHAARVMGGIPSLENPEIVNAHGIRFGHENCTAIPGIRRVDPEGLVQRSGLELESDITGSPPSRVKFRTNICFTN